MKNLFCLAILVLGIISNGARAQRKTAINNSIATIQQRGSRGAGADYNNWGLLILVGVIGFSGFISRKKQLEQNTH